MTLRGCLGVGCLMQGRRHRSARLAAAPSNARRQREGQRPKHPPWLECSRQTIPPEHPVRRRRQARHCRQRAGDAGLVGVAGADQLAVPEEAGGVSAPRATGGM